MLTVQILPEALVQISELPKKTRAQIGKKIDRLASNPFPPDCTKLEGKQGIYRVRSGNYRILYRVSNGKALVTIVKVGDRKDVYRNL